MKRDAISNIQAVNASGGAVIDTQGFTQVAFLLVAGALDAFPVVLVEDGNDPALADAAAVPDRELNGNEALAAVGVAPGGNGVVRRIGYRGVKRYVRVTADGADAVVVLLAGEGTTRPYALV